MKCLTCGKQFDAKRNWQRYCSKKCRYKGYRQGLNKQLVLESEVLDRLLKLEDQVDYLVKAERNK